MSWNRFRSRSHFYASLWRLYLRYPQGLPSQSIRPFIPPIPKALDKLKHKRVHFWVPHRTAGSQFILWDVIPHLIERLKAQIPSLHVSISETIPGYPVDILFSFKEPVDRQLYPKLKHVSLVICDEADRLWNVIGTFDSIVCTSSVELAQLLHKKKSPVLMIPEVEPSELLEQGGRRLDTPEFGNRQSILWHGGLYTLKELVQRLAFFEELHKRVEFDRVIVVCGDGVAPSGLNSHPLFEFRPWSRSALSTAANECRLALLPARSSLKLSYLKPASRLRCIFALGCVALGDARVPEVTRFSRRLGMPIIPFSRAAQAAEMVAEFWNDSARIRQIQHAGHEYVKSHHHVSQAIHHWINAMVYLLP